MLSPKTVLQNRYEIMRLLGQGGMGAVYQARDRHLKNHLVAIKENLAGDARQFEREAEILVELRHPNLPRVTDHFVEPNGAQYLVMDFVEGETLEQSISAENALTEQDAKQWLDGILSAVAYLHRHGVIHRDIKPANIIRPTAENIRENAALILVDFGIAKLASPGNMTTTSARAATPGFAAPEQYTGGTDARTDVYALGATLFFLLTGKPVPDARARDSVDLKSPHEINPVLSPQISEVVLRALALEPIARYQSVEEMQDAIHAPPFTEIYVPLQPKIEPAPIKLPVQPDSSRADAQNRKTKSGIAIGIVALIAVIALVCAILILPRVFAPAVVIAPTATQIAIAPTATREVPTSPPITTVAPTITRTLTPLPTATRTASPLPTNTPIPAPQLAPGVYVTNIRTLPPNPRNVDAISFVVTFFNNAGPLRFKWCVYLFPRGQPNTIGQTSCDATIDFPLGTYEYTSLSTWRLGTGTSCVDLNARVQGIETDGKKLFFKTPQGSENIYFLTVCP